MSQKEPGAFMIGDLPRLGFRVLVVDDSQDIALSWQMLLEIYGFETDVAFDGETALRLARENQPEAVLLDLSMPRMSGLEVARQMRELFGAEVCLIAVTAHGFEEDRQRCFAAGFDCHFTKSAAPTAVVRLLTDIAGRIHLTPGLSAV